MTVDYLILVGAIFVLLILSAFFSGSETALTRASLPRMHELARQGNRRADLVLTLYEQRERLIGAILLGNNLMNILSTSLATTALLLIFGDAGIVYATIAMTLLVLIFAEVMPKTIALAKADQTALFVAPLIQVFVFVFAPVTRAVHIIINTALRAFGINLDGSADRTESEEERGHENVTSA